MLSLEQRKLGTRGRGGNGKRNSHRVKKVLQSLPTYEL